MQRELTLEKHRNIIKAYQAGMSVLDVAKKEGLSAKGVVMRVLGEDIELREEDGHWARKYGFKSSMSDETRQMRDYWKKTNDARTLGQSDYHSSARRAGK